MAALCLGGTVWIAAALGTNEPGLAAASNQGRTDLDGDGLTDQQELVIGTLPYRADTDADGYSDLEERARASDPLDHDSLPAASSFSVGTCASMENGVVSMLSAVYVNDAGIGSVDLQIGIVYKGHVVKLQPRSYVNTRGFLFHGSDTRDALAVVEVALPQASVARLHQVNLFSIVRGNAPNSPPPVVSVLALADFSGVSMAIEEHSTYTASGGDGPTGVVYRPLTGNGLVPPQWTSGQICFQRTAPVGMNGVSVVHEVEHSECLEMDTYCSSTDCAAAVGSNIELPDPFALAGG